MAEQLDLTTPIPSKGGTTFWTIELLAMCYKGDQSYIKIKLVGENDERLSTMYYGQEAVTLIQQLNKLDMSTTSMQKRILQKLVTDGKIDGGTITGEPD